MTGRSPAIVEAELREVERHLTDMPPHSASGVRDELRARAERLRRELADARDSVRSRGRESNP